jgi:hypothetical protein
MIGELHQIVHSLYVSADVIRKVRRAACAPTATLDPQLAAAAQVVSNATTPSSPDPQLAAAAQVVSNATTSSSPDPQLAAAAAAAVAAAAAAAAAATAAAAAAAATTVTEAQSVVIQAAVTRARDRALAAPAPPEAAPELPDAFQVSEKTTHDWLGRLGYEVQTYKAGGYFDGHSRVDVVKDKNEYLAEKLIQDRTTLHQMPTEEEKTEYLARLPQNRPFVEFVQDESCLNANQDNAKGMPMSALARPKR